MCLRDPNIVVVLSDDWQSMLDGSRGDQRVGELDGSVNTGAAAVGYKMRPSNHRRLADRDWVSGSGHGERVSAAALCGGIGSGHHTKLKLADRNDRHRNVRGELSQRP